MILDPLNGTIIIEVEDFQDIKIYPSRTVAMHVKL